DDAYGPYGLHDGDDVPLAYSRHDDAPWPYRLHGAHGPYGRHDDDGDASWPYRLHDGHGHAHGACGLYDDDDDGDHQVWVTQLRKLDSRSHLGLCLAVQRQVGSPTETRESLTSCFVSSR